MAFKKGKIATITIIFTTIIFIIKFMIVLEYQLLLYLTFKYILNTIIKIYLQIIQKK
jgi:hypothetical protein